MTTTAIPGPSSVTGAPPPYQGPVPGLPNAPQPAVTNDNPDFGPSLFWAGIGVRDIRYLARIGAGANVGGYPNQDVAWKLSGAGIDAINAVPNPAVSNNIAASQATTVGGLMTLAGASTGVTVLTTPLTILPTGNVVPAGALVFDGNPTWLGSGQSGAFAFFNPANSISRCLILAGSGSNVTIRGNDVYGTPITQTLGAGNTTKAFKFIRSITSNAIATGVTIGTNDTIGLPLYASSFAELKINYGNTATAPTLITSGTGFVAGVTSTASASTGDTRGTYALQTPSDGTLKLTVYQALDFGVIANSYAAVLAALIGVPQYGH